MNATMKAGAVVLLGMALAGSAWGASVQFNIAPDDPFKCEFTYNVDEADFDATLTVPNRRSGTREARVGSITLFSDTNGPLTDHPSFPRFFHQSPATNYGNAIAIEWVSIQRSNRTGTITCPRFHYGHTYTISMRARERPPSTPGFAGSGPVLWETHDTYHAPLPPAGQQASAEPVTTGPAPWCESVAIVPAIPPAVRVGDGDSRAHWLRITNPLPASVTFAITGHDSTGAKFGTYRRTLAANAMTKVRVRDIEAAFDGDGTGWWSLTVAASGPVYVVASMLHTNGARVVLPVERPAACPSGPVTRTGA